MQPPLALLTLSRIATGDNNLHSNISLPDLEDVVGPQSSSAHFSVTPPASPLSTHQDRWPSHT